jgi:phosphonate transport system permease protein
MTTARISPSVSPPPETAAPSVTTPVPCVIRAQNLGVTYTTRTGAIEALQSVDFEVPAGQHVAIIGLSGSGKTTLLGCLSGRIAPSAGSLSTDGRIAVIHQDLRLVKERTALQNVLHGALGRTGLLQSMRGFGRGEREKASLLLKRVGLSHRMHVPVMRLSGGEQQRVAIARALMQEPRIILADEPVASLDNVNARAIMQLLVSLAAERKLTMVSVLHDCDLAEAFADRILGLEHGRVVYDQPCGCSSGPLDTNCHACQVLVEHRINGEATLGMTPTAGAVGMSRFGSIPIDRTGDNGETTGEPAKSGTLHAAPAVEGKPPDPLLGWMRPGPFALISVVLLVAFCWSAWSLDISSRQLDGAARGMGQFLLLLWPTSWEQLAALPWRTLLGSLVETMQMSMVGTTLAVLMSWPLAALAANNVAPRWLMPMTRGLLNVIRTIPSLVWALVFVAAVGIGPLAGVLALVAYSIGYLTKFFYEAFEAVDPGPPGALREIGASGMQRFLHAIWPASRPAVLSSSLFMLEYNVRAASVLGIVGAGGIGFYIKSYIDWRNFPAATVCLLLLLAVVVILDTLSTRLRAKLVG